MNNLFLKNIQALEKRNVTLAKKLKNYVPNCMPQLAQQNGAYNILYKNTLIHNSQNPLAEANEIFSGAENTPVSIHLIYGIGLGYLFQLTSLKSKGTVILYEPDLNILWLAFTLVDFSNDILKKSYFLYFVIKLNSDNGLVNTYLASIILLLVLISFIDTGISILS